MPAKVLGRRVSLNISLCPHFLNQPRQQSQFEIEHVLFQHLSILTNPCFVPPRVGSTMPSLSIPPQDLAPAKFGKTNSSYPAGYASEVDSEAPLSHPAGIQRRLSLFGLLTGPILPVHFRP